MRLLITSLILAMSLPLVAQLQDESPSAMSVKFLFIEHGKANSQDGMTLSNGLEVAYIHNISRYFNIAVPGKVGQIRLEEDLNKTTIWSLDALLQARLYKKTSKFMPYVFAGAGIANDRHVDVPYGQIPVGAGLNYQLGRNSYLTLQAEYRKAFVKMRNNMQFGIGYWYQFGPGQFDPNAALQQQDTDGDGVLDLNDECPEAAGTAKFNGCPDSDGDGVVDKMDDCPFEMGDPATKGCPNNDRDGDGVVNKYDNCPDMAGTLVAKGCPDSDGDGFADENDDCPMAKGMLNGCPDSDGDGISDVEDECPNEKGIVAKNGCPAQVASPAPIIKKEDKAKLEYAAKSVQFETGSAILTNNSYANLDAIIHIMMDYPESKLKISGHTDNVGNAAANQLLSEQRAKACYDYIISKNISPFRAYHRGYGDTWPIRNNDTPEGRLGNRRVEMELVVE